MKQSSKEVRNPELVKAMRDMNQYQTGHTRSLMAEALMNAHLLAPVQSQTVVGPKSGPEQRIKFEEISNTEGDRYYLAFTDMGEYDKWNEDGKHNKALIMTMEDFGNILIRHVNDLKGFVINPYNENVSISKDLLLSLLKQREAREHAKKGN